MASAMPHSAALARAAASPFVTAAVVRCMLMAPGFALDRQAHNTVADVLASELPGNSGYAAGFGNAGHKAVDGRAAVLLPGSTATDGAAAEVFNPVGYSPFPAGVAVGSALFYVPGASAAASPILGVIDPDDLLTTTDGFLVSSSTGLTKFRNKAPA